jgi:ribosomal protein S18 acetylase RimI-like enzyme
MSSLHFEPVTWQNLDQFVQITRETLWLPAWPGDAAILHDYQCWPRAMQDNAFLIFRDGALVGRVTAPLLDDVLLVRDLGLYALPGLAEQVSQLLLKRAWEYRAPTMRVIIFASCWSAFERLGFTAYKRRTTMEARLPVAAALNSALPSAHAVRPIVASDVDAIGELMYAAYRGTIDDAGEDQADWLDHTRDVLDEHYGAVVRAASLVMPLTPPFQSATLVIENAPHCALLAQVVTHPAHTNRGYARRLIAHTLHALAAMGYRRCVLEATIGNENAQHLYRSFGFAEIGPQIVYGIKSLNHL